jgi:t-SNARE complex subunit (syntaxin)
MNFKQKFNLNDFCSKLEENLETITGMIAEMNMMVIKQEEKVEERENSKLSRF